MCENDTNHNASSIILSHNHNEYMVLPYGRKLWQGEILQNSYWRKKFAEPSYPQTKAYTAKLKHNIRAYH